ncbi:MAG: ABC transporter ATP-binding protein [Bacteroidaceae bacterium]|nr:ABC transporter ATP-binding protein [Bacteroidaceae bacterium]
MTAGLVTYQLQNLNTGYRQSGREKTLSRQLSAQLYSGELTCLIGSNGVGKSTLLRTMARLQSPLSGEVLLFGKPLHDYASHDLACQVGIVLTDKLAASNLRAEELVAMGRLPYSGFWGGLRQHDREVIANSLRLVGMDSFAQRRLWSLSDGELQKLMIAKALAQETPVILLDEPVAFLDFPSKVEVLGLLRKLAREQKKAILLSIHDLELALQSADCIWLLTSDGHLAQGSPAELAQAGKLDFFFAQSRLSFNRETLQYTLRKE